MNQLTLFEKQIFDFTHKLTGENLRLKKEFGNVAVCYIEKPFYLNNRILIDTCICSKENLINGNIQN